MFMYENTCCTRLEYDDRDVSCWSPLMIYDRNDVIRWFMLKIDDYNLYCDKYMVNHVKWHV